MDRHGLVAHAVAVFVARAGTIALAFASVIAVVVAVVIAVVIVVATARTSAFTAAIAFGIAIRRRVARWPGRPPSRTACSDRAGDEARGEAPGTRRPSVRSRVRAVLDGRGGRPVVDRGGPRERGVTLIELMVTIAILSIVLASAAPGFGRLVSSHRAAAAVGDLAHDIALARSEALRRNRRVYLAPLTAHWRDGWAVFADRNDNRIYDPLDELVSRHDALPDSVAITNPNNPNREPFTDVGSPQRTYILFDGSGYPRQRNGALNIGSLVVTDRTGGTTTVRTLCLASFGRVRIVVDRAGCS